MRRREDGKLVYAPYWVPDFPANLRALDDIVHNTGWKWLRNWWYRRSWSKLYFIGGVMVTRLGFEIVYQILKDGSIEYRKFTALLFLASKRIKEKLGLEAYLPFLWGCPDMWSASELSEMGVFVLG